jgi:hypothetical protein
MRQRIRNNISLQVKGTDLSKCSDIRVYIAQQGVTYEFSGTVNATDPSVFNITIPKATAMKFKYGEAKIQLALTNSAGEPRASNPVRVRIGELLKGEGYGE